MNPVIFFFFCFETEQEKHTYFLLWTYIKCFCNKVNKIWITVLASKIQHRQSLMAFWSAMVLSLRRRRNQDATCRTPRGKPTFCDRCGDTWIIYYATKYQRRDGRVNRKTTLSMQIMHKTHIASIQHSVCALPVLISTGVDTNSLQ